MQPTQYYRQNKTWKKWLGKTGVVIASTTITTSSPELKHNTPYSYILVDFEDTRHEFMGTGHDTFQTGDLVECVLRRASSRDGTGIIGYVVKLKKNY